MAPTAKIITQPTAKLRLLNARRFTIGFLATSNHQIAPVTPRTAMMAQVTMRGEPNQSSSSPRSSMICRLPNPMAIKASPG